MTGDEPDYRFTLANERTFLAYLRTSLAFYAGGLSAVQFLDLEQRWVSRAIGVVLVLAGLASTIGSYVRWKQNLAAMRANGPLPASRLPLLLATAIALAGAGGLIFSALR
ncbi:MAG: YidH family protein [Kribbellaceae bacterium]